MTKTIHNQNKLYVACSFLLIIIIDRSSLDCVPESFCCICDIKFIVHD